jgi:hypothetical protein
VLCDGYAKLLAMVIQYWLFLINLWNYPDRSLVKAAKTIRRRAMELASTFRRRNLRATVEEMVTPNPVDMTATASAAIQTFATTTPTPVPGLIESNFTRGAPGSIFVLTAPDLPTGTATMSVRGPQDDAFTPLATLDVPDNGSLVVALVTGPAALPGTYTIRLVVQPVEANVAQVTTGELTLTLDNTAALRTEQPDGVVPEVTLPAGSISESAGTVYLPLVRR